MKKLIFMLTVLFICSGFTFLNKVEALIKKEITVVFKIENYSKKTLLIPSEINSKLPIKITDTNFFKIINEDNTIGYYYVGQAYGKADFFDYLVIFDKELIVSKVKILAYRENHGGEVRSKRWLKQFVGVGTEKTLKYRDDIIGISGATISVKSMVNEVNKMLKTVHILNTKKLL